MPKARLQSMSGGRCCVGVGASTWWRAPPRWLGADVVLAPLSSRLAWPAAMASMRRQWSASAGCSSGSGRSDAARRVRAATSVPSRCAMSSCLASAGQCGSCVSRGSMLSATACAEKLCRPGSSITQRSIRRSRRCLRALAAQVVTRWTRGSGIGIADGITARQTATSPIRARSSASGTAQVAAVSRVHVAAPARQRAASRPAARCVLPRMSTGVASEAHRLPQGPE